MNKSLIFLTVAAFLQVNAYSQAVEKRIHSREQLWLGVLNQTRFSDRWGAWLDVQYRMSDDFVNRRTHFLFRPAVTYFITDNLRANFGYALIRHYPARGFNTARTEQRPWQQIWWNQKYNGFTMLQWIRFEQRFNPKVVADVKEDGYNYNFRIRYNMGFSIPLRGKEMAAGVPFASIINEVFINLGDNIIYNTFDQNRFFAGFGYNFTSHLNAQLGYMHTYQQEASGMDYVSSHTLRLFFFQTLDLRRD